MLILCCSIQELPACISQQNVTTNSRLNSEIEIPTKVLRRKNNPLPKKPPLTFSLHFRADDRDGVEDGDGEDAAEDARDQRHHHSCPPVLFVVLSVLLLQEL